MGLVLAGLQNLDALMLLTLNVAVCSCGLQLALQSIALPLLF